MLGGVVCGDVRARAREREREKSAKDATSLSLGGFAELWPLAREAAEDRDESLLSGRRTSETQSKWRRRLRILVTRQMRSRRCMHHARHRCYAGCIAAEARLQLFTHRESLSLFCSIQMRPTRCAWLPRSRSITAEPFNKRVLALWITASDEEKSCLMTDEIQKIMASSWFICNY